LKHLLVLVGIGLFCSFIANASSHGSGGAGAKTGHAPAGRVSSAKRNGHAGSGSKASGHAQARNAQHASAERSVIAHHASGYHFGGRRSWGWGPCCSGYWYYPAVWYWQPYYGGYGYRFTIGEFERSGVKFDLNAIPTKEWLATREGIVYADGLEVGFVKKFTGRFAKPLPLSPGPHEIVVRVGSGTGAKELATKIGIEAGHITTIELRFDKPGEIAKPEPEEK
jgi:hypothetical protein